MTRLARDLRHKAGMSGAAGAPVTLAPANRLSRTMSALTLLSVIAPVGPNAPRGSSCEAATGFQGVLAALTGADSISPEAAADAAVGPAGDEVELDAPTATGFPAAPIILPPPVSPHAADPKSDGEAVGDGLAAAARSNGQAIVPGPSAADVQPRPVAAQATPDSGGTGASLPLSLDKASSRTVIEPQAPPPVVDARPTLQPPASGASRIPPGTVTGTEARAGAAPVSTPAPTLMTAPPLRPLVERTSRPLDGPAGKSGDAARAADSATPTAAAAPTPASRSGPDPTIRPPDFAAALIVDATFDGETGGPAADLSPAGENVAAQALALTPAAVRETGLSQLSRSTIDATAQIAAQILRKLEGRSTRFEMALTPDDLGRVDISLDIDAEGRLNARLAFDNPAAATDLRGRADELRRQLEDAGFHLADDAFEFTERDSGSSAFDRSHDNRNGQSRAFTAASRLNAEIDVAQPPRWLALSLSPSGVDMKV